MLLSQEPATIKWTWWRCNRQ